MEVNESQSECLQRLFVRLFHVSLPFSTSLQSFFPCCLSNTPPLVLTEFVSLHLFYTEIHKLTAAHLTAGQRPVHVLTLGGSKTPHDHTQ